MKSSFLVLGALALGLTACNAGEGAAHVRANLPGSGVGVRSAQRAAVHVTAYRRSHGVNVDVGSGRFRAGDVVVDHGKVKAGNVVIDGHKVKAGNVVVSDGKVGTGNVRVGDGKVEAGGVKVKDGNVTVPGMGAIEY